MGYGICLLVLFLLAGCACRAGDTGASGTITITLDSPVNTFTPSNLGAGIDGHHLGDVERMLSPANVKEMLTTGLRPISYRLRTELAVDAWHWNPHGTWSDAARRQGYWISDAHSSEPIRLCYGYHLPRRGNTTDEANDDGYSRLDDGDPRTFWKSNPYLDEYFTHEPNARHPQCVVVDLGEYHQINAIRIRWGAPFATRFTVDYGGDGGPWLLFRGGNVHAGKGGENILRLGQEWTRYIRIQMTAASGKGPEGAVDVRDRLGYAIREVEAGMVDRLGNLHDCILHSPDAGQTGITVSSTDPWHRESDRDDKVEQPGFDMLEETGLTNGLPMLAPVAVIYDTPENAAAEVVFLKERGYDVPRIEMGEEPDGQKISPEDYGALYTQWAGAIHKVAPGEQLGGPCFETLDFDKKSPDWRLGNGWWTRHFLDYLAARRHSRDFNFFSFEWYPFDYVCMPSAPQLLKAPGMLRNGFELMRRNGITARTPMVLSEFGYSAFAGRAEVDLPGALLNADITGLFLTLGGETAYLYGYEPNVLQNETGCSWGNNMLFLQDAKGGIRSRIATYYAAQMVTQQWAQPSGGRHQVFQAQGDLKNGDANEIVTAYAVLRPDKRWGFLLINKDPAASHSVLLQFERAGEKARQQAGGPYHVWQFSSKEYAWQEQGATGFPTRSEPPSHEITAPGAEPRFQLPAYSLTVVQTSPWSEAPPTNSHLRTK